MSSLNTFFPLSLDNFYFDRVWVKAYPFFFRNLRIKEYRDIFFDYRDNRVFEEMTDNAFRLYRTLDCIRRAIKRGVINYLTVEKCEEIRKYGEQDYYYFNVNVDSVDIWTGTESYTFTFEQVKTVKFITYVVVYNDQLHYEKAIYYEYSPWLRVMIKPYLEKFTPPMVRVFYNPLIRAKQDLGIDKLGYESQHDNFVDPELIDFEKFKRLNWSYFADKQFIANFVNTEWKKWFNREERLTIKYTQVELSHDTSIPKLELLMSLHNLGGRAKTIKNSVEGNSYTWTDSGLKYYITIKKGFQVKVYTKAWTQLKQLNRLEFTLKLNEDLDNLDLKSVFQNKDLEDSIMSINKSLGNNDLKDRVKEVLKPLVKCRDNENCEKHYAFWLDLLTSGSIKGSSYYHGIMIVYKRAGLVKVKGRGRNSVYTFNENLLPFVEKLRELLGISFKELTLPRLQLNNQNNNPQITENP